MKCAFAALLLAAIPIGGLGWRNQTRLTEAREQYRLVEREAARHGIRLDSKTGETFVTRRPREERTRPAAVDADDVLDTLRRMHEARSRREQPSPEYRRELSRIVGLVGDMSLAQLRALVREISSAEDLPVLMRLQWASEFIEAIHRDRPEEALELCLHLPVPPYQGNVPRFFRDTLGSWVERDPDRALSWLLKHIDERRDLFNAEATTVILRKIAARDPRLAFEWIGTLAVENPNHAPQGILASAKTSEERIEALAALREYLPSLENPRNRADTAHLAMAALGSSMVDEGFESTVAWIETAGLSQWELANFGSDFGMKVGSDEAGLWLDWFAENLAGSRANRPVGGIMRAWTREDYVAAGEWLTAASGGEARNIAISVYAGEVARLEPEVAAMWAEQLPDDERRLDTLRRIYSNWPKNDEASRAAAGEFARDHGL